MRRAALNDALLRPTALDSFSAGTISATKVCRTGRVDGADARRAARRRRTRATARRARRARARPSPSASTAWAACVAMSSRRRSSRSASTPADTDSSRIGANCRAVTVPTATPESSDSVREHEPVLRDALHPGADVGDEAPGEPQAVVDVAQRGERRTHERGDPPQDLGRPRPGSLRSARVSAARRWESQASRRRRVSRTSRSPASVTVTSTCRRSVGCSLRATRPISTSRVDGAGHGRRLDVVALGEVAGRERRRAWRARRAPSTGRR